MRRYGKTKSELLDSWLEMDAATISQECSRMGLKATDKHIENIQNLFEHLNKIEAEMESSTSEGKPQQQENPRARGTQGSSEILFRRQSSRVASEKL